MKIILKKFTSIFIFLLIVVCGYSQKQIGLRIEGKVKEDKSKLDGVTVTLYKGTTVVNSLVTTKSGLFSFLLDFNNDFIIQLSKNGYTAKKLKINTKSSSLKSVSEQRSQSSGGRFKRGRVYE